MLLHRIMKMKKQPRLPSMRERLKKDNAVYFGRMCVWVRYTYNGNIQFLYMNDWHNIEFGTILYNELDILLAENVK